jgi:SpoVK/Ycf46/Vps4 family AAA+-type ATPase
MSENRVVYTQWLKRGTNTYFPTDNSETHKAIDSGIYNIRFTPETGYYIVKKDLNLDELINLPSPEGHRVLDGIKTFWKRKDKFEDYGFSYKRGILLYGVPGGGKTSIINLLCKELIENMSGVVFTINNPDDLGLYKNFMGEIYRVIEKDRPIITIIEDIDGLCQHKEVETSLLNVLDGIEQLQNVVYLATTNYTERLSERILNRPNRFDMRIEVKSPNDECRRMYLEHKLKPEDLKDVSIETWIEETRGMTMAHLGEVIKSVVILGNSFEDTIQNLHDLKRTPTSRNYDEEFNAKIGFGVTPASKRNY